MRHGVGHRTQGHDRGGVDLADDVEDGIHVGAPAQVGLGAVEGDDVVLAVLEADGVEGVRGQSITWTSPSMRTSGRSCVKS